MSQHAKNTDTITQKTIFTRLSIPLLLILILAAGASLRLTGLDWDGGKLLHPDERFLSWVTADMQPVDSIAGYFDTQNSTLNPNNVGFGFYVYGDFPIIVTHYIGQAVDKTSLYTIYLAGRYVSTGSDLLTIVFIFLTASVFFDKRVGLIAAALYAGSASPIQQSHFYTVDTMTNLLVAISFYFMARLYRKHNWFDYPLFGLFLGLGMASKVSIYPLAVVLMVALAIRVWRETDNQDEVESPPIWRRPEAIRAMVGLVIAGIVTVLVFRVAMPYAFLPPNTGTPIEAESGLIRTISKLGDPIGFRPNPVWLDQMDEVRRQVSGYSDIPPNHQWGKRLPVIFPLINVIRVGLGYPLGIFAWLAMIWAIWEIGRGYEDAFKLLIPVLWTVLFFVWQGIGWVKTMRYFLPTFPYLLMIAGWAIITIWDRVQNLLRTRNAPRWAWPAWVSFGLGAAVIISGFAWGFAVSRIYTRPITRIAASDWVVENIPSDVTLYINTDEGVRPYQIGLPNVWLPPESVADDPAQPTALYTLLGPELPQPYRFEVPFSGEVSRLTLTHVADWEGRTGSETLRVRIANDGTGSSVLMEGQITDGFDPPTPESAGKSYTLSFAPIHLEAGQGYYLILEADAAGSLIISGSSISTEGDWDDPIPLSVAPYNVWGAQYQPYTLQMAWEDIDTKRERMKYVLDHADYLTISSNRFYDSLTRNPQRYVLSVAYYEALFSGELGFELIADFTSRPNLGGIEFNDDRAEEAWTVYDHPRVFIFKKTAAYSSANTAAILDAVDLDNALRVTAKDAKGRPLNMARPELADSSILTARQSDPGNPKFNLYRDFQPLAVIVWWAAVLMIGWVSFPILYRLFPGLPDRGYAVGKIFGMLLVAWLAWMAASLKIISWGGFSVLLAILLVGALSWLLVKDQRDSFIDWLKENRKHLLFVEGLTLFLFLIFLLIRWNNPDLWHPAYGGEKPMDLSYFNAVLKSETFPPYDPWFSGGTINYYYFGFVLVGAPVKLTGIPVTVAYNLILPTLFALTGIGAFSAAYGLLADRLSEQKYDTLDEEEEHQGFWQTVQAWPAVSMGEIWESLWWSSESESRDWRAYGAGIAALLMTVILGNLDQIRTLIWGLAELGAGSASYTFSLLPNLSDVGEGARMAFGEGRALPIGLGEWYWNATRLIPVPLSEAGNPTEIGPITEFPFFTFLYADLHAHMIAMPISLLSLVWGIGQIRNAQSDEGKLPFYLIGLNLFVGALVVGALRPTNTWDFPAYLVIAAGALVLAHIHRRGDLITLNALGIGAGLGGLVGGLVYFATGAESAAEADLVAGAVVGGGVAVITTAIWLVQAQIRQQNSEDDDLPPHPNHWMTLIGIGLQVAAIIGGTFLLFLPFLQNYNLGYTSAIPWMGSRTPLWAYLDITGLFLYLIVSWMVLEFVVWWKTLREDGSWRRLILPGIGVLIAIILATRYVVEQGNPVGWIVIPLIALVVILFFRKEQAIEKRAALAMLALALSLTLIVEIVVLGGDIGRMNTVFKFYVQVWILMALVAGTSLGWLWDAIGRLRGIARIGWLSGLTLLLFLATLYPLLAARAKMGDRWAGDAPSTLDGMAYMPYANRYENGIVFNLAPDYHAIRWLEDNIKGTPVILEAHTTEYLWGNRITAYTGLPSVIGWNWHQRQQRPGQDGEVWERVTATGEIYTTGDTEYALDLLRDYQVELIILGDLERAYYDPAGLAKFDRMVEMGYLTVIYEYENTIIYRVVGS